MAAAGREAARCSHAALTAACGQASRTARRASRDTYVSHDPESIREAKLPQSILKYFARLLDPNGVLFLSLRRPEAKLLTRKHVQHISHRNFLLKHHLTYLTTRMRRLNPYHVIFKVASCSSSRKQNASNIKPTLLAERSLRAERHVGMRIVGRPHALRNHRCVRRDARSNQWH